MECHKKLSHSESHTCTIFNTEPQRICMKTNENNCKERRKDQQRTLKAF